jgi:hypothetical protein
VDNFADDFEAWASFAARLRVVTEPERRNLLEASGLAATWDALHETWAARMNAEIAAGRLDRPTRYLELCAREEARAPLRATVTLVGADAEALGRALPFGGGGTPTSTPPTPRTSTTESAAAFFAGLRASSAKPIPSSIEGRAITMMVAAPVVPAMNDERDAATLPAPAAAADGAVYEGFLKEFRASLMPPSPVLPSSTAQEHTLATPAGPQLEAASRARAQELASSWPLERLAEFVDAVSRMDAPASVDAAWARHGVVRPVDREFVRTSLEIRLRRDPAVAARYPGLALRRG